MFELISILGISFLAATIVTTPSYLKLEKEKEENRKERNKMLENKKNNYTHLNEEQIRKRELHREERQDLYKKLMRYDEVELYDYLLSLKDSKVYVWQESLIFRVMRERKLTPNHLKTAKLLDEHLKGAFEHIKNLNK